MAASPPGRPEASKRIRLFFRHEIWYTMAISFYCTGGSRVEEKRFAVLIDAENVSNIYIKYILDEISNYGSVTYKRIYGDWTSSSASGWKAAFGKFPHPGAAIQLYLWQKRHRFGHDYRCHGHPLFGECGGLLPGVQRQRFYQAGNPSAGVGHDGDWHGGKRKPQAL